MRWFTDDAYEAEEGDWDRVLAGYQAHVDSISPQLPPDLLCLATQPRLNLHDARFREVRVDREAAAVDLVADCGDLQVGYRRITLRFESATIVPDNLYLLAEAVGAEFRSNHWHRGRTVTEIRAQEVDLGDDGKFVLRLRLWPFYEFAVEFAAISLDEVPLAERSSPTAGRFVVGSR